MTKRVKTPYPGIYFRDLPTAGRRYEIAYTDSLGKRVFKTVDGDLKDAQRERADILVRLGKGEKIVSSRLTVKDLAEDYLRTQTGHLKPHTLEVYSGHIDTHIVPRLGKVRVSELDAYMVSGLVSALRKAGKSSWTIHGVLSPLSQMMVYAVQRGWAAKNPVKELTPQQRPSGFNRPMRILSQEEIGALLRASTDHFRPFLMTAIFTGLRIGELLSLEWGDVDFDRGLLNVHGTKTEAADRTVVLPPFLQRELAKLSLEKAGQGLVFTTKDGKPLDRRAASRGSLERCLSRAKVPHCRFHDLRHTFASILIGQGEDVTFVADQMGHSSPAITLRIYAKLFNPEERREAARSRMQQAFEGVVA